MKVLSGSAAVILGATLLLPSAAAAQTAQTAQAPRARAPEAVDQVQPRILVASDENAEQTRERLRHLLGQYPDTLIEILRRDPSLLHNDAYLTPYAALAAFLVQHPEVGHNPAYFLGSPQRDNYTSSDPSSQRMNAVRSMFESLTTMVGFVSFFAVVGWVIKAIIDQRAGSRALKAQNEAHAKVIDRLASNEDLLAYIQTPAGQRYLGAGSAVAGVPELPMPSASYSRILSSVQIGMVGSLIGFGFLLTSSKWASDPYWEPFSRLLFLVGVVALFAGVGFVLSGVAAYLLSRRLGLIPPANAHA